MNNKEKYIAEVDSLKAGEELRNAILENSALKPKKSVYKKIIPLAACLVIAVLVALPGFVFRAGRAKNTAQEYAFDSLADNAAADEAVAEEIEDEKAVAAESKGVRPADSGAESGSWYPNIINRGKKSETPDIILTFSDSEKVFVLNGAQSETVYDLLRSVTETAETAGETDTAGSDNYVRFDFTENSCLYYPETGIADINGTLYKLDDTSKNVFDDILSRFTDR